MLSKSRRRSSWLGVALLAGLAACRPAALPDTPTPTAMLPTVLPTSTPLAQPAPDFTLTSLTGEVISLSALRGQWVLVNFWATWCLPCITEMPYLQQLGEEYAGRLTVLAINLRESPAEVEAFAQDHNLTLPLLLDPDDAVILGYQALRLPTTVMVDPAGQLVERRLGPLDPTTFDAWLADRLTP